MSAGTLFTHLDPALAKAGPLPSANNMVEGGVNSQPGPEWDDGAVREDLRHGARRPFWLD